ncbi:hypothetical protein AX211_03625 [Streptococcus agalactiae]|uniref:DUF3272 domain-containing protein n=1 Tax=Streptococcus agalactiae TaxID=1311 RepID=UPI0008107E5F|nr:DUF3272 domain-containing protein [Streptococcus agalactiae]MCC9878696.1 DUF3272 domain-containing protein [Streptococcus agalactiae]MCW1398942.1 DUF3272 domain-containing protein [Streptococcus agalactiae]OCM08835.1 hypothetical protein AX211_03625 [Streptococcus agalactiae]HEN7358981.1 DUF3272 domain-containing protein [Streptococcus agalactiae]HEN8160958.1 DUF3272 domain-containing protein [Streptococcus agalactiae]
MTKRQFIFMALLCSFETYFFNQSVMDGSWIFAIFGGVLLLRDLQKVYAISKFTKELIKSTKKKD